jgi:hypothetical protein
MHPDNMSLILDYMVSFDTVFCSGEMYYTLAVWMARSAVFLIQTFRDCLRAIVLLRAVNQVLRRAHGDSIMGCRKTRKEDNPRTPKGSTCAKVKCTLEGEQLIDLKEV